MTLINLLFHADLRTIHLESGTQVLFNFSPEDLETAIKQSDPSKNADCKAIEKKMTEFLSSYSNLLYKIFRFAIPPRIRASLNVLIKRAFPQLGEEYERFMGKSFSARIDSFFKYKNNNRRRFVTIHVFFNEFFVLTFSFDHRALQTAGGWPFPACPAQGGRKRRIEETKKGL